MSKNNHNLFKIFSQNERKLADLYALYALAIPSQEKMWTRLSGEEVKHSVILLGLDANFGNNEKSYTAIDEAKTILDYVGAFIDQQISEAKSGNLSAKQAITVAMRLEQSMIERKCFEIFATSEPEIISVLERLNKETEGHFKILKLQIDAADIY